MGGRSAANRNARLHIDILISSVRVCGWFKDSVADALGRVEAGECPTRTGASVADFVATLKSPVPTRPPLRKGQDIPSLFPMMHDQSSEKEPAMRVQEVSLLVFSIRPTESGRDVQPESEVLYSYEN